MNSRFFDLVIGAACLPTFLAACGGSVNDSIPQLTPATGATLASCTDLATKISFPNTTITAATQANAGDLTVGGQPIPAHCLVSGAMFTRVSPVDGKTYTIGFEMRLPNAWNGRFFYQANGGIDGAVSPAVGGGSNGPLTNALYQGFAVISSDAGHNGAQNSSFGLDPQARLDYGYQAVAKLTPMAKSTIQTAYGKGPDRSYFGGCSNGGRHTLVAAARYADQYDGFLAGDPGFRLPLASTANMAGAQAYNALATTANSPETGFTAVERSLVSNAVLKQCDGLDGVADGLVQDTAACQAAFNLDRDVPTCTGARDGTCLSAAQKTSIAKLFNGATTSTGTKIYSSFPFDAGLYTTGWASWKFSSSISLDPSGTATIFEVPPENPNGFAAATYALTTSIDTIYARIQATNATYTESSLSFMTPPNPTDLSTLRDRGAKMMVYHGTSDPIFSSDDTTAFFDNLAKANGGSTADFARFFRVPGMNHCSGGPSTDQFDMLTALVNWVEKGQPPDSVIATARGTGNAGGVNADVPATWSQNRTRPLCAYPKVARYKGSGSIESADSFSCQ